MVRYFLVVNVLSYQRERADKNCKKGKRPDATGLWYSRLKNSWMFLTKAFLEFFFLGADYKGPCDF